MLLFIPSCAAQSRLYNLCFTQYPQQPQHEYVAYGSFKDPKNCTRYPDMWHQEFPILVVAPPAAFNDVRDMALEINDAVGKDLFEVRMRYLYETVDRPDDDAVVYVVVSDSLVSLCEEKGGPRCVGYAQFWRREGEYYATIVLYDKLLKSSTQRRAVVKHELLHVLGLKHSEKSLFDAMWKVFGPKSKPRRISQEDLKILRKL